MKNATPKSVLKDILTASVGLFLFALGTYFTIQANLGAAPWDTFNLGLSKTFGIKFGTASISVSMVILMVDILLKEKIGIGMFLDAFICGKSVDLFNALNLVPAQTKVLPGLALLVAGIFVMGWSMYFYMKTGLGCGPRDTLLVGLSRRLPKVPIGAVSICILAVVTLCGWLLGGPVGIGTLLCAGLIGPVMQLEFHWMRFDATAVRHRDLAETARVLFGKKG